jgi:erythronate-4-phosphate dehydrogenase
VTLILVDENIPGAGALMAPLGEVKSFRGRELCAADVRDASALLVRSVTPVNSALLAGSKVQFVGSTTIGTDHLDTTWLDANGIRWCAAPGSNAESVVDYCMSALCIVPDMLERLFDGGQVGIIGYGNVGSRLHKRLQALGIDCRAYDPFLSAEQCPIQASLQELLTVDFLSLHTPLTRSGLFPTQHLLSLEQLAAMPRSAVILNAGRGEVLASATLQQVQRVRPDLGLVLDVWENEPAIATGLLDVCAIGTPHIAGYSQDGKWNGLMQVASALAQYFGVALAALEAPLVQAASVDVSEVRDVPGLVRTVVLACYDIRADDRRLRDCTAPETMGKLFDQLRRTYPARREVSSVRIRGVDALSVELRKALVALGVRPLLDE